MFDLQTAFFIPIWRRIAVTGICFLWSLVEFINQSPLWALLFLGLGIYCLWQFFLDGWPEDADKS